MAVTETEQTPEERFAENRRLWRTFIPGPSNATGAIVGMLDALNDRLDSLDAEVNRLTNELRNLQGARS